MTLPIDTPPSWEPTASLEGLRARARMLADIRRFFMDRQVLEVETPILSHAAATEPNLESFATRYQGPGAPAGERLYLHTSPEFAMKRLLASGCGPIYQICRVFRDGEAGRLHNPEFTMLEWYRPGFDHHRLMDEVEQLVAAVLGPFRALGVTRRLSYAGAFLRYAGLDPHRADAAELARLAAERGLAVPAGLSPDERDGWLDLLLTQLVEPQLGTDGLCFLYDYPASQASLAQIRPGDPAVAERFELYLDGIELANGFHELLDVTEQARRFDLDRRHRTQRGQLDVPADRLLLGALDHGLPACAGVALGVDRLLMVALGAGSIRQVIAFPVDRA